MVGKCARAPDLSAPPRTWEVARALQEDGCLGLNQGRGTLFLPRAIWIFLTSSGAISAV